MNIFRRKQINKLADIIREKLGYNFAPYLPTVAVEKLGGKIKEDFNLLLTDIDAKIIKTPNGFEIRINPNQAETRLNFSIAHELGHLFLHMGYLIDDKKWNEISDYDDTFFRDYNNMILEQEYEANEFAAAFLMPEEEFLDKIKENVINNVVNVEFVAQYFNVSLDAVINRGRWLGVFSW